MLGKVIAFQMFQYNHGASKRSEILLAIQDV
jgi:hypothetical protein